MKTGIQLIAEERQRQIEGEGWTYEHDNQYNRNELVRAAVCYLLRDDEAAMQEGTKGNIITSGYWPFSTEWWRPSPENRIKELSKAGALIAAEIDRLQSQK